MRTNIAVVTAAGRLRQRQPAVDIAGSARFTDIVYIFSSYFLSPPPLFNFVFVLYVFTAAFCQQFIKEYDDDDDDDSLTSSSSGSASGSSRLAE